MRRPIRKIPCVNFNVHLSVCQVLSRRKCFKHTAAIHPDLWALTALAKFAKNAWFIFSCGCGIWCGHGGGFSNSWGILPSEAGSWVWRSLVTSEQWTEHTFIISWARLHRVTSTDKLKPLLGTVVQHPHSRAFHVS